MEKSIVRVGDTEALNMSQESIAPNQDLTPSINHLLLLDKIMEDMASSIISSITRNNHPMVLVKGIREVWNMGTARLPSRSTAAILHLLPALRPVAIVNHPIMPPRPMVTMLLHFPRVATGIKSLHLRLHKLRSHTVLMATTRASIHLHLRVTKANTHLRSRGATKANIHLRRLLHAQLAH
jgi:hypothetical protein